jgi:hypothetical protein
MKVLSEKSKELSPTFTSLMGSIKKEKGCQRRDFCQSMEDENELQEADNMNIIERFPPIQSGSAGCATKLDMRNAVEPIQRAKTSPHRGKNDGRVGEKHAFRKEPITLEPEDLNTHSGFEIKKGNTARDNSIQSLSLPSSKDGSKCLD